MNRTDLYNLGSYCREFRRLYLHKTLEDVQGNVKIKGLSHFEHGRSTNLIHLSKYLKACETDHQKKEFMRNLEKHLGG